MNMLEVKLASQEFYELMQAYRHESFVNQDKVCARFEDVKRFLLDPFAGLSQEKVRKACFRLFVWNTPAKQWCYLNRMKDSQARTEMLLIEREIGKRACINEWNRNKWYKGNPNAGA